ncbi:hypothetical protein L9G16_01540 [Shewanella sp. A25]|nr:hypothetical protein [Shewanella shenzhenensis]
MRRSNRQNHLKQQHKITKIRRKHYFHAAQQHLPSPLPSSPGFSTLAALMQRIRPKPSDIADIQD